MPTSAKQQPKWLYACIIVITLLGLWWRVDLYAHREWTTDENNQHFNTKGPLKPFWTKADYCEVHSFPGDYLLTFPFVHAFGTNKWGVAIPHILTTLLGFGMLFLICQRYLLHPLSWIISFSFFSLHSQLIFHALELRPYSLLTALSLTTFYILDDIFNKNPLSFKGQLFLYWLVLMLTIIYHPYGFIMISCVGFFFLLRDWKKSNFFPVIKERLLFWISFIILGTGLWVYYSKGNNLNSMSMLHNRAIDVFQFIPNPMTNFPGFIKSFVGNLLGCKFLSPLLLGVLISLCWPKESAKDMILTLLALLILPILLILTSDSLFGYWFIQRQFIWVISLFAIVLGLSWDKIFNKIL